MSEGLRGAEVSVMTSCYCLPYDGRVSRAEDSAPFMKTERRSEAKSIWSAAGALGVFALPMRASSRVQNAFSSIEVKAAE